MIFRTSDGIELRRKEWLAPDACAVLLIIHGFGDASARFEPFAKKLTSTGIHVLAYDQRGHGESPGNRGDLVDPYLLESDALDFVRDSQKFHLPVLVWGHSAGGQIAVNALTNSELRLAGVILTSAWFRLKFSPPLWKRLAAQALLAISPGLTLSSGLHAGQLSHDTQYLAALPGSLLTHQKISARMFRYLVEGGCRALTAGKIWRYPVLIFHGAADPVTDWTVSEEFFHSAPADDKVWRLFENGLHELQNDCCRDELFAVMKEWISLRIGK